MALIGKIMTVFSDKDKISPVFPRTKTKAVSDDNGVVLDTLLSDLTNKFGGCWISFTDENGNPTSEPYIHWNEEV